MQDEKDEIKMFRQQCIQAMMRTAMEDERECKRGAECKFALLTGKAGVEFHWPFEKVGEEVGLCYLCKKEAEDTKQALRIQEEKMGYAKIKNDKGFNMTVAQTQELAREDTIQMNVPQEVFDMFERVSKEFHGV
jgi:hypothetical protein